MQLLGAIKIIPLCQGLNLRLNEADTHLLFFRLQYLKKCEELFELSAKIEIQKQEEASSSAKVSNDSSV